jgi:peptide chain release factor 2
MQPYQMVKDHRTKFSVSDPDKVLDGDLDPFIMSYLLFRKTGKLAADDTGDDEEE